MKTSRILIAGGLLVALLLAGCYMMGEDNSGSIALNAQVPSRSLTAGEGPDDEVWLLGFLIEESYAAQLQDLIWMEDLRNDDIGGITKGDVADQWQELVLGAVRFDGGKPYFQFKMNRVDSGDIPETEGFTVAGIPADRSYFLYIIILEDKIESLDDLGEDPVASMGIHYYNTDNFNIETGNVPTESGMYYFQDWDITETAPGSGVYDLAGDLWDDVPAANQPFSVTSGETTVLDVLLVDR